MSANLNPALAIIDRLIVENQGLRAQGDALLGIIEDQNYEIYQLSRLLELADQPQETPPCPSLH